MDSTHPYELNYIDYLTQLEHLDQQITLTLQEIDKEFANCYNVVSTKIIPKLHKFNSQSKQMVKLSEPWLNFFNRLRYDTTSAPASPNQNNNDESENFMQYNFDDPRLNSQYFSQTQINNEFTTTPSKQKNQQYLNNSQLNQRSPYQDKNQNNSFTQISFLEDDIGSDGIMALEMNNEESDITENAHISSTPIASRTMMQTNTRTPGRSTNIANNRQHQMINSSTNRPPPIPSRAPLNTKDSITHLTDLELHTPSFIEASRLKSGHNQLNSSSKRPHNSLGSLTFSNSILPQQAKLNPNQNSVVKAIPELINELDNLESQAFELPSFIGEYTNKKN